MQRNWGCLQNWFRVNRWKNIPPNLLEEDWFHLRFPIQTRTQLYILYIYIYIYYIYYILYIYISFFELCNIYIYTYFRSWCHLNLKIWASTTSLKLVPRSFPTWRWHPLVCSHPPPQVRFAKLTPIDPSISACDQSKNIGIHHTSLSWDLSGLDFSLWTNPPKKNFIQTAVHLPVLTHVHDFSQESNTDSSGQRNCRLPGFQDVTVDIPLTQKKQQRVTLASGELPGKIPRSGGTVNFMWCAAKIQSKTVCSFWRNLQVSNATFNMQ